MWSGRAAHQGVGDERIHANEARILSSDEDVLFFERPLFSYRYSLPASSGSAASISARVIAPNEGARFVYDKKPLQKHTYVTIWENTYGEGGRAIYEPHEHLTARIEATIDTLINEFAEAWTHSQGIGHPKYGAPYLAVFGRQTAHARRGTANSANIAKLPELLSRHQTWGVRRGVEAAPKFLLAAIPVAMVVGARIVAVVAMMVAVVAVSVAVAKRCVAVTGVHRLLGRCDTR